MTQMCKLYSTQKNNNIINIIIKYNKVINSQKIINQNKITRDVELYGKQY